MHGGTILFDAAVLLFLVLSTKSIPALDSAHRLWETTSLRESGKQLDQRGCRGPMSVTKVSKHTFLPSQFGAYSVAALQP
jgi:hypothetical protein